MWTLETICSHVLELKVGTNNHHSLLGPGWTGSSRQTWLSQKHTIFVLFTIWKNNYLTIQLLFESKVRLYKEVLDFELAPLPPTSPTVTRARRSHPVNFHNNFTVSLHLTLKCPVCNTVLTSCTSFSFFSRVLNLSSHWKCQIFFKVWLYIRHYTCNTIFITLNFSQKTFSCLTDRRCYNSNIFKKNSFK